MMSDENGHQNPSEFNGIGGQFVPAFKGFPSLPIVTPGPPPRTRTQAEKYGGLFYLGIGGLAIILVMVGWFSFGVWRLRDVWANVYILSDRTKPEDRRIEAAFALSRDFHTNTEQRREIVLRKDLPELARYLVAESLGADIVNDDLRGYPRVVAKSEGWPNWLRLLLTRTLALASANGASLPAESLEELRNHPDRMIGLWAAFAEAVSTKPSPESSRMLAEAAAGNGPELELAEILQAAVTAKEEEQRHLLERATIWLRTHHPEAIRIWKGWEVRDGKLVHTATP